MFSYFDIIIITVLFWIEFVVANSFEFQKFYVEFIEER